MAMPLRHQPRLWIGLLPLAFAASNGRAEAPPPPWGDLLRAIEAHVPVQTQRVEHAAVQAALLAVDPQGRLLPRGEDAGTTNGVAVTDTDEAFNAEVEHWPQGLLRIRLNGLHAGGQETGVAALRAAMTTNATGIVFDIRGAGGESLSALDSMCGLFFKSGTEVYRLVDGYGHVQAHHTARADTPPPVIPPVMLLIDNRTRGASETLAAVLRTHPGTMLLGTPTRGDSARRERIPCTPEEDLYVATAWIVPADGPDYYPLGVQPHLLITGESAQDLLPAGEASSPEDDHDQPTPPVQPASPTNAVEAGLAAHVDGDPVLRRAADILLSLHALGTH